MNEYLLPAGLVVAVTLVSVLLLTLRYQAAQLKTYRQLNHTLVKVTHLQQEDLRALTGMHERTASALDELDNEM